MIPNALTNIINKPYCKVLPIKQYIILFKQTSIWTLRKE